MDTEIKIKKISLKIFELYSEDTEKGKEADNLNQIKKERATIDKELLKEFKIKFSDKTKKETIQMLKHFK